MCSKCNEKHAVPTGKKCTRQRQKEDEVQQELLCSKCNEKHAAPTGKKCSRQRQNNDDVQHELLAGMEAIQASIAELGERVASLETPPSDHEQNDEEDDDEDKGSSHSDASAIHEQENKQETSESLRQDPRLMKKIAQRMRELNLLQHGRDSGESNSSSDESSEDEDKSHRKSARHRKKKGKPQRSGRVRTTEEVIMHDVEWPHFHVYRGAALQPAVYDDIHVDEFVYGYLQDALELRDGSKKRHMLQHLADLMGDSLEYGWESARNSHGIVLQKMEVGKLSWRSARDVARTRAKFSRLRPAATTPTTSGHGKGGKQESFKGPLFCVPFQDGQCKHHGDHSSNHGHVTHICAFCCKQGFAYRHPEAECRKKVGHQ